MKRKYLILAIFFIFLLTRLYFLFTFPPFTDESLYIRYGQLSIHNHDFLWSSLQYLHRQPLAIWIFGFGSLLFGHPLFGARLMTLLINIPVFFGIWGMSRKLFSEKMAVLSVLILTLNPLIIFTQSTALMDGILFAISCYIVWLFSHTWKYRVPFESIGVGILLGLGLWIKSTALMLLLLSFVGVFLKIHTEHISQKRFILHSLVILIVPICILLPLILHNGFDVILKEPSTFVQYGNTLDGSTIRVCIQNAVSTLISFIIYFTPVGVISLIAAISLSRKREYVLFTLWWTIPFAITIFVGKSALFRYSVIGTVALIPILAYGLQNISDTFSSKYIEFACFGILGIVSLFFIVSPAAYFHVFPKITGEQSYAIGWPSGYGIPELTTWIDSHVPENKTLILAVPDSPGNPSDYLLAYYYLRSNVQVIFVTVSTAQEFRKIESLSTKAPIFLATRGSLVINDIRPFLIPVVIFPKPYGQDDIGLYSINFNHR